MNEFQLILFGIGVIALFYLMYVLSVRSCKNSIKNKTCEECDGYDSDGKIIKSGIGTEYWVCQKHFPENHTSFLGRFFK